MGYHAVRALAEGRSGSVICTQAGSITEIEIEEALAMKKNLPMIRYEIMEAISAPAMFH